MALCWNEVNFLAPLCAWPMPHPTACLKSSRRRASLTEGACLVLAECWTVVRPNRECRRRHSKHASARANSAVDSRGLLLELRDLAFELPELVGVVHLARRCAAVVALGRLAGQRALQLAPLTMMLRVVDAASSLLVAVVDVRGPC